MTLSISQCCLALEVNKSSYYKWLKPEPKTTDIELEELIYHIFTERKGTYGKLRIQLEFKRKYSLTVKHRKVYRIMKELGLVDLIRRK